jgi:hypothetical protein
MKLSAPFQFVISLFLFSISSDFPKQKTTENVIKLENVAKETRTEFVEWRRKKIGVNRL